MSDLAIELAMAADPVVFAKMRLRNSDGDAIIPDEWQERILRSHERQMIANCCRRPRPIPPRITEGDRALIATCERWVAQWHAEQAVPAGLTGRSPALAWSLRRDIAATRAASTEAMQAKARVLACLDGEDAGLARSIARDLTMKGQ